MRKNMGFTVAAAIMGLTAIFFLKSSVDATSADVQPKVGNSSYVVASGSYLPFRVLEPL